MYFSVLNFCLLLPGVGEWTFRPLLGLALTVRCTEPPGGRMLCLRSPADTWRGRGEGWLAGVGPGLSSFLLPVCASVGLKEGEPSPASRAWFPLIDVRCKLPFMLGRCGDLVTHWVLPTLKTGMGGQWVTIPVCCHLLQS